MAISVSTAGTSATTLTADSINVLATYTEKLCAPYCVNSSLKPQYSVVYSYDTPTFNGSTAFVPITATISVIVPSAKCCGTKTYLYTEKFNAAFVAQTAAPTSVTITSAGSTGTGAGIKCCKASQYVINDSLTITIS